MIGRRRLKMIKCPDKVLLLTYLDGSWGKTNRHLEKHLEECRYCTRRLQGLAETQQICHEQIDILQEYYQSMEIKDSKKYGSISKRPYLSGES
jgi:hypothetical protein